MGTQAIEKLGIGKRNVGSGPQFPLRVQPIEPGPLMSLGEKQVDPELS